MNLFELEGTVTALGQCVFDNTGMIYAYITITDASGQRTMIEKVAVGNDIGAVLALDRAGGSTSTACSAAITHSGVSCGD